MVNHSGRRWLMDVMLPVHAESLVCARGPKVIAWVFPQNWGVRKALFLSAGIAILLVAGAVALNLANAPVVANLESNAKNVFGAPRHPVTPEMDAAAKRQAGQVVAGFRLPDQDGKMVDLEGLVESRPTLFLGVKDGCPCNLDAQTFFNDLYAAYGDKVNFYGVLDADAEKAKAYRRDLRCEFPILVSPEDDAVFKALGTKQSVYTTLVGTDGKVIRQWPGYSKKVITEISAELARLAKMEPANIDLTMAPEKPTSGCYFFEPVGWEPENKS
mgnify:CR=1 FL=1